MQEKFAEVVLNLPVDLCLTYQIPPELEPRISVGHKVLVPLGKRHASGFVTAISTRAERGRLKSLVKLLQPEPFFGPNLVKLVRWVSEYYFCSFPRAVKTALPAPVRNVKVAGRVRIAVLSVPKKVAEAAATELAKRAPKQAKLIELLLRRGAPLEVPKLLKVARAGRGSLASLEEKGLVELADEARERDSWAGEEIAPETPLTLNPEQKTALKRIKETLAGGEFGVCLLAGITGSGKTEIYLRAIDQVLKEGRQAIVLVPEIALTPQTGERFKARFGSSVAIIHSALAAGERFDQWQKIASGRASVVLGPRSAVFAPVKKLGMIVVDEEHVTSYKQSVQAPFYHARDVAVMRAKLEKCTAVLGSATPSLESYRNSRRGKYTLLSLRERPDEARLPAIEIVDLKREVELKKKRISFSSRLLDCLRETLDRGEQAILFLNRRGFYTLLFCRSCGHVAKCPHCSISLTYHKSRRLLVCHLCGHTEKAPKRCPSCRSGDLSFSGLGTQRIEDRIGKFFPRARTLRMDTDTVTFRGAHRKYLKEFEAGKIDILIGTQMIAKGLDYPNVTLVGVIFADTALNLADFRATEYTFQLLTQVAGRSGRGGRRGKVIIQTYSPRHPAIRAAARQEYEPFFEQEIGFREELGYPPVNHFIALTVLSRNEGKALKMTEHLARSLEPLLGKGDELLGPAPPPFARIRGWYRWQLIVKTGTVTAILKALEKVLPGFYRRRDVRIEVDVDPVSML